jgi:hypothetical protein
MFLCILIAIALIREEFFGEFCESPGRFWGGALLASQQWHALTED